MSSRRSFLARALKLVGGAGLLLGMAGGPARLLWAATKRRILGAQVKATNLAGYNPASLDPRNLAITPIEKFGTMGTSDFKVDLKTWRLEIDGLVQKKLRLDLAQLQARPVLERKVLLICPGVFSYYARWQGLSLAGLLKEAGLHDQVTHIEIRGPKIAGGQKYEKFPLREVLSDQVFLAYRVNGVPLPIAHGYPLRVVAGDHYGDDWVKYVYSVKAVSA
jgi:DMSO/TMAO reductase YedYZ molybdopterin-dependent catalytic subunit